MVVAKSGRTQKPPTSVFWNTKSERHLKTPKSVDKPHSWRIMATTATPVDHKKAQPTQGKSSRTLRSRRGFSMRFAAPSVLLVSLAITFTCAQTNNLPKVQHVVIVIQENRTPDNLFQQDQTLINNGAHILSQGLCLTPNQTQVTVPLSSTPLGTCWDTGHGHQPDWTTMWSNGAMKGACQVSWSPANCTPHPPLCSNQSVGQYCPAMTYVQNSVWTTLPVQQRILDPYFQIANQYGWANYMFQTNQGPSFPAHQFLFSGTSAPIQYGDLGDPCNNYPCWEWFDAGNVTGNGKQDKTTGCIANLGRTAVQINPLSVESLPPTRWVLATDTPATTTQHGGRAGKY